VHTRTGNSKFLADDELQRALPFVTGLASQLATDRLPNMLGSMT
jgi:hypothetical protein